MPEAYDKEAVQQILQLAMVKQGQEEPLLRSQLVEIAEELGISEITLAAAEEEWKVQADEQQARDEFFTYSHHQLRRSIAQHIAINSVLVIINGLTTHRIDWAVYPAAIWGLAILWQAWQVLWPENEQYNRAFRRWRLRQQIGESFKVLSERLKMSWTGNNESDAKHASIDETSEQASNLSRNDETTATEESSPSKPSSSGTSQLRHPTISPTTSVGHMSPSQKSRKQNRINQHHSSHNRISHLSRDSHRERDQNGADHLS
ncbi:MAG: 2TM domain-containing protein [Cyanobacteria bacterium P01_E01_bin.6]